MWVGRKVAADLAPSTAAVEDLLPTSDARAIVAATASDDALVAAIWSGDDAALAALLDRYRDAVRARARSYFLAGADRDDVVQEGMIGLFKAIRDFDADQATSFRGFADLCVTRQIITAVKGAARQKHAPLNRSISLHLPAHSHGEVDGAEELIDRVPAATPDPADDVVWASELLALEEHVGQVLSDLEVDVLRRYVAGHTYSEIADALGRHVKSIDNAIQRIKRKVDDYLVARRASEVA